MKEVTTTSVIPAYFPTRKKTADKRKKVMSMKESMYAVELVEDYGIDPREAITLIIERDYDKAAKLMAQKATNDPEKQKELESKYKDQMEKRMKETGYKKKKMETGYKKMEKKNCKR